MKPLYTNIYMHNLTVANITYIAVAHLVPPDFVRNVGERLESRQAAAGTCGR